MKKRSRIFNTFKLNFIILFVVLLIIIFLLQIFMSQYFIRDIVSKKSQVLFDETISHITKRLDIYMAQANNLVIGIKRDQRIKNYLSEIKKDRTYYFLSRYKITREVLRKINLDIANNVYIYTHGNQPINCFYSIPSIETPPEYRRYLEEENNLMSSSIVWRVKSADPYILEAVTYIKNGSEVLGLLVINFDEAIFDDTFIQYRENKAGEILLLDSSNNIIYYTQKHSINKNVHSIVDEDDIIINHKLDFSKWSIIGILNKEGLNKEIRHINEVFIIVFIMMIGAIAAVPVIITNWVIKPMDKIVKGMQNIQEGNYNFQIPNDSKNEFRIIIDNFNFMVRRIRGLIQTTVEQQKAYRQAEIEALKSKLSPHFLYNTLDMIHWMLILEDKFEIADVVTTLSNILRYSMTGGDDYVTVGEDIEQISHYLTIQRLRFEGRLEYEVFAEDSILDCKIPRLLIQPLVENAIKYAFPKSKKDCRLFISVKDNQEDEFIYLVVKDNGVGMSNEKISKIQSGYTMKSKKSGFGIQLVQRTIQLTYGRDCGLIIESVENKGTTITAKIKKNLHVNH